jgi:hypothetical protein
VLSPIPKNYKNYFNGNCTIHNREEKLLLGELIFRKNNKILNNYYLGSVGFIKSFLEMLQYVITFKNFTNTTNEKTIYSKTCKQDTGRVDLCSRRGAGSKPILSMSVFTAFATDQLSQIGTL